MPVFARVPEVVETTFEAARWIGRQRTGAVLTLLVKLNRLTAMPAAEFLDGLRQRIGTSVTLELLDTPELAVAGTWNEFMAWSAARGDDRLLVMNHDALLETDTIEALLSFGDKAGDDVALWSAINVCDNPLPLQRDVTEAPDFSCYMVDPRRFVAGFGRFDENFSPAYFEDNDAHARLVLGGMQALRVHMARYYHQGSNVLKFDAAAAAANHGPFTRNAAYFASKWGRAPLHQPAAMKALYFASPFNNPDMGLNDWPEPTGLVLL